MDVLVISLMWKKSELQKLITRNIISMFVYCYICNGKVFFFTDIYDICLCFMLNKDLYCIVLYCIVLYCIDKAEQGSTLTVVH